jgi:hypothetical protein
MKALDDGGRSSSAVVNARSAPAAAPAAAAAGGTAVIFELGGASVLLMARVVPMRCSRASRSAAKPMSINLWCGGAESATNRLEANQQSVAASGNTAAHLHLPSSSCHEAASARAATAAAS